MAASRLSDYFIPGSALAGAGMNVAAALLEPEDPRLKPQAEGMGLSNRLLQMDITEKSRLERQRRGFSATLGKMFEGAKLAPTTPLSTQLGAP